MSQFPGPKEHFPMLKVGIEHEFVFADKAGQYLDSDVVGYTLFKDIVDKFPSFEGDDVYLDCKSLEKYPKRCYVEGFERHAPSGELVETIPKGLEIRTLPHTSVDALVEEFRASFTELERHCAHFGLSPVLTSRHPFKNSLSLESCLNPVETRVRTDSEMVVAIKAMLSHGMHINVSMVGQPIEKMRRIAEKVNYYVPVLIPWSFSSPFYQGSLFEGLCSRNYFRAHYRKMVDIRERQGEHVLEFRGFDACGDARLFYALIKLYCGFLLNDSLPGRLPQHDETRLKLSSMVGFEDPDIMKEGRLVLDAAKEAVDKGSESFELLETMLNENDSHAARMKSRYAETGDIMACISRQYNY